MTKENKVRKLRVRSYKLSSVKKLSDDAKNLIVELEKFQNQDKIILSQEQSKILIDGYNGQCKNSNILKSSFMYIIARVLHIVGNINHNSGLNLYPKSKTINNELVSPIKRVKFENGLIGLDFSNKTKVLA